MITMCEKYFLTPATRTMTSLHLSHILQKQNTTNLLMRHHPRVLCNPDTYDCPYEFPWLQSNVQLTSFPLSKQEAVTYPQVAQNAFHQIIGSFPSTSLEAYTDGSLTVDGSFSCTAFILVHGLVKMLAFGQSIYSVELEGIKLALDLFLGVPNLPSEIL